MNADPRTGDPVNSLPGFRLLRVVGRGGAGAVYEAHQESMDRRVALKIMEGVGSQSLDDVVRFEREAWIGGRLTHPSIVKVFDRGIHKGRHYLVMEYVEGGSLDETVRAIRDNPPPDANKLPRMEEIASLFCGVADALEFIHIRGVIHRDVKPSNLLLDPNGPRLLLTDFGVAHDERITRLTRSGDMLGTIAYMSPEQLRAKREKVDRRSDLWSLGVSLYEAVTLRLPFSARTEEAYFQMMNRQLPAPPRAVEPAVPQDLEAIILKCLEHDLRRRYATAGELRADLERYLGRRPVSARIPSRLGRAGRWVRLNRRIVASVAAFMLLAVTTLASVGFVQHRDNVEAGRYHQYMAYQVEHGFDLELLKTLRESLVKVERAAREGRTGDELRAAISTGSDGLDEADMFPVEKVSGCSLIILEGQPLLYRTDPIGHPGRCFVGGLLRDGSDKFIATAGCWLNQRMFLTARLQPVIEQRIASLPPQQFYGGGDAVRAVSVSVLDSVGHEMGRLRSPRQIKTAGVARMTGPFEGFSVRVAPAASVSGSPDGQ